MNKKWEYLEQNFEYKQGSNDFSSPWSGHVNFAYDLISNIQPNTLVELGSYKGTSTFAFAQAAKDKNLTTKIYALDSWEGDDQSGFYGEDIYNSFINLNNKFYKDQSIIPMKMYFSEAAKDFSEDQIDILHIDGLHTYEAVKEDYETWEPKTKENSVILFHDVNVSDYGVRKFFDEIINSKQNSENLCFEFKHSNGLGVIVKGEKYKELFNTNPDLDLFIKYYEAKAKGLNKGLEADFYKNKKEELSEKYKTLKLALGKVRTDKAILKNEVIATKDKFTSRLSIRILNRLLRLVGSGIY